MREGNAAIGRAIQRAMGPGMSGIQGSAIVPEIFHTNVANFAQSSIVGANPVTEWQDVRGRSAFDLDTVVGTGANLTTLPAGAGVLTGTSGDNFTTPDSVAASITSSITLIVYVAPTDWTPAGTTTFISKYVGASNKRAYSFEYITSGVLRLTTSANGTATVTSASTAATGFTDGTGHWLRVTWDNVGDTVNFFTSNESPATELSDITWVQLGNADVAHVQTGLDDSDVDVEVGTLNAGTAQRFIGKIHRAHIISGTDETATPAVDFDARNALVNTATWASNGANGETWTANGDAFVNATGYTGILTRGSVGLETTAGQDISNPNTVFIVFKPTLAAPPQTELLFDARSDNAKRQFVFTDAAQSDRWTIAQDVGVLLTPAYDTNLRIFTCQFNGDATTKLTVSDVGSVTGNAGTDDWDFGSLFMAHGGTNTIKGMVLELVVFDSALSAGQITEMQNFLAAKYSL